MTTTVIGLLVFYVFAVAEQREAQCRPRAAPWQHYYNTILLRKHIHCM